MTIPYYVVRERHGRRLGYWQPTARMKALGFAVVACGEDGPDAWKSAKKWADAWDAVRTGREKPTRGEIWPRNSLGEGFLRFKATREWARKAPRTREDWERGWKYIGSIFGDCDPRTVDFDVLDDWYSDLLAAKGVREAHRAMKIWRALWNVVAALGYCEARSDPSKGIRRQTPKPRSATWREGEVVRLVKRAWRSGYHGMAALIAVEWDSSFSPGDVRKLSRENMWETAGLLGFQIARSKTGAPALATLQRRCDRLLRLYLDRMPETVGAAPIFRNRAGAPYSKDTLGDDFRDVRLAEFGPDEKRQLQDMRRSGAIEALAGDPSEEGLAALAHKMGNTIDQSKTLQRTYLPVSAATVHLADEARKRGRTLIRGNKAGRKV